MPDVTIHVTEAEADWLLGPNWGERDFVNASLARRVMDALRHDGELRRVGDGVQ